MNKILIGLGAILIVIASSVNSVSNSQVEGMIELNHNNTLLIRTGVDEDSILKLQQELVQLNTKRGSKDYPIYLVLDTPGGSVYAGDQFIQFLKGYKNIQTITIFAASMGAMIVELHAGKRFITDNGILMFHRASGRFEGQFEEGELESQLNFWKAMIRSMEDSVAKRVGLSLEEYKRYIKDEWWLRGEKAISMGAADEVINVKCTDDLINDTEILSIPIFAGVSIDATYSKCPLLRNALGIGEENESK